MDKTHQSVQETLLRELKQAQAKIDALEKSLESVTTASSSINQNNAYYLNLAGVIVVQLDTQGNITMIGGHGYQLLGYSTDALLGQNWFETCLPQQNVHQVRDVYRKLMSGDIADSEYFENEILTKSGELRYISWHNTILKNESGKIVGCLSSGIDITKQKRTENRLRERELTLSKVQEIAQVGSWEWDVVTNKLEFSPELYRIYDITPDEFDGSMSSLYDRIIHPEDRAYLQRATELAIQNGEPQQVEFRVVRKDGSIRFVWGDGTVTYDNNGVLVRMIGIVQDVTALRKSEEALRQNERQFRNMIEASPIPFALNDEQLKITYINSAFIKTFGYTLDDIPTLDDWWPKAYPDEKYRQWVKNTWQQRLNKSKQEGTAFEAVELDIRCKDGSVRTALVSAASLSEDFYKGNHLVSLFDVTERKRAEQAISHSEARYRMIVETAQEGIWTIDAEKITSFVNPVMAAMLGYSIQEMLGRSVFEFMDEEGHKIASDAIEYQKTGKAKKLQFKLFHKDGSGVWTEINANPMFDANGTYLGSLAMITDITDRRRTEKALRDVQNLLLRAESLAHIGSWEWEVATNKVNWSPEMYRIYDIDPQEHPVMDFSTAMSRNHPEDAGQVQQFVEEIFASRKQASIGTRIMLPDGSIRHLWSESKVIQDSDGNITHLAGSVQDITERVKAEQELREGHKRFNALFEQSAFGVAKTDSNTGQFVEINQRFCDIVGYTKEELLALDFKAITFAEDLPKDLENFHKLKSGELSAYHTEKRYVHKSGSIVWIALSVLPLWVLGKTPDFHLTIVEDITQRKITEEKLRRHQEEQEQLINSMTDAVIVIGEEGLIQTFSTSAEVIFGYERDEILGQNIKCLMPESYAKNHDSYISNYLTKGIANIIGTYRELTGKRKSGEIFPLRLTVAELPKNQHGQRRFVGTCRDITLEKQQEEQLRRAQKMDAMGKLTGGIAHDYNNMLGVILGYSNLLMDVLSDDEKLSKYINEVHRAAERGTKLSRKLLAFSHNIQPEADVVSVNQLLSAEQDMLQKTLTPRIKLELDLDKNVWPVYVNSSDLEDAILNLSINAMHAIEANGSLIISSRNYHLSTSEGQQYKISAGDYVALSFIDSGCGIHEGDLSYIFDPFFTTKGQDGVGLGLSMVYGFVQRSGGGIKVESVYGQGSKFTLYLPRHLQTERLHPVTVAEELPDYHGTETILVVDDEPAMVDLSKEILTARGYKVLTANGGGEALHMLALHPVDLLVSDVVMPGMDGYQLADRIHKDYPGMKILLVSGFTDDRQNQYDKSDSNQMLLAKPFSSHDLLKHVRSMLDNRSIRKESRPLVLIMDDDANISKLFKINLEKLGYEAIEASDGAQAIELYTTAIQNGRPISAAILDVAIPGGIDGPEAAQAILAIDPQARLIVSSGNSAGPIMTDYQKYGFSAVLEKNFDRKQIKSVLDQVIARKQE